MKKHHESAVALRNFVEQCFLCKDIQNCGLCINQKEIGLKYMVPEKIPINIMFVAESPPAPEERGFFYRVESKNTKFRDKLFDLLNKAGLGPICDLNDFNRKGYYLADAINCRWDKTKRKSLRKKVLYNCSEILIKQLELLQPRSVVAMGSTAKTSLTLSRVSDTLRALKIHVEEMQFILGAGFYKTETDGQRITKLSGLRNKLFKNGK